MSVQDAADRLHVFCCEGVDESAEQGTEVIGRKRKFAVRSGACDQETDRGVDLAADGEGEGVGENVADLVDQ